MYIITHTYSHIKMQYVPEEKFVKLLYILYFSCAVNIEHIY